jgi:hypothetical protein
MAKLTVEDNQRIEKELICDTKRHFERAGFKVPKIARELARIAFADITNFVDIDDQGIVRARPLNEWPRGKGRMVRRIKEKRVIRTEKGTKERPDGEQVLDATFEFELHDKLEAIKMAVDILGMKKPLNVKVNGKLDFNIDDAMRKLADGIAAIAKRRGSG